QEFVTTGIADAHSLPPCQWLSSASITGVPFGKMVGANVGPSIEFSRVPQADEGGRDKHDIIEGRVTGARPGQQIVLYARRGKWWLQPLVNHPFTKIQPNAKWINATHLGTEYAALLVEPGFHPPTATDPLPARGGEVAAVAIVKGQSSPPSKSLQFSGYEWRGCDAFFVTPRFVLSAGAGGEIWRQAHNLM